MKYAGLLFVCVLIVAVSACARHEVVTYAEFKRVAPNMTLQDVERIVGVPGRPMGEEVVYGTLVATLPNETVYYWQNKDGSNMSVSVVDGKVVAKTETSLR